MTHINIHINIYKNTTLDCAVKLCFLRQTMISVLKPNQSHIGNVHINNSCNGHMCFQRHR